MKFRRCWLLVPALALALASCVDTYGPGPGYYGGRHFFDHRDGGRAGPPPGYGYFR